jgi:hypothetical protein
MATLNPRAVARLVVVALGLLFFVLAVAGAAQVSAESDLGGGFKGGNLPALLWGVFGVNTVLNLLHFLLAALALAAGASGSRMIAGTVAGAFALLVVYDLVALAVGGGNPLAINVADIWLHVAGLVILVGSTLVPERQLARRKIFRHAPIRNARHSV